MSVNQIAKATVFIDSQQAEAALNKLGNEAKKFADKMNVARKANDKAGFDKARKQYKEASREMKSYKKTVVDVTAVLNNLNGTSLKKLSATQRKLQTEINSMNRSTKQEIALYNQKVIALKAVKAQTAMLRNEMMATKTASTSMMSGMANAFNKYSMMAMSAFAAIYGLVTILKSAVEASNKFYASVSNLSALTGLTGNKLDYLTQRALHFSGSTTEAGIRITQSAEDIINAYTQMGSKRPELLQNKQALADVTEQAIILSKASNLELVPATNSLATAMNMFNASAEEAPRFVNAMAAGSKSGAGNVLYLTDAIEKSATAGRMAGITIEETVAAIETIAPTESKASKAGIRLKNIFLKLQTGADQFNPKIVGLSKALDNLAAANLSTGQMVDMFTVRNLSAAKVLIDNREEYKRFNAIVTDTNVAMEQAAINSDNNQSKMDTLRQRTANLTIELGQKLTPALSFSHRAFGKVIKATLALIAFFKEYRIEIITLVNTLTAYYIVTRLQAKWDAITTTAIIAKNAIMKAYAWTIWTVTDRTKLATFWTKAWNWALKTNPILLVITLLTALGTALYLYSQKTAAAEAAQKRLNEAILKESEPIVEEKVKLELLMRTAKAETKSKQDRFNAIAQLRQISPKYLQDLNLENINTEKGIELTNKYIESLERKAKVQAAQDLLIEVEKELFNLKTKGEGAELKWWQTASAGMKNFIGVQNMANDVAQSTLDNMNDKVAELNATKKLIFDVLDDKSNLPPPAPPASTTASFVTLTKLQEDLNTLQAERLLLNIEDEKALKTNATDIAFLQKKIKLYNNLGKAESTTKSNDKAAKELDAQEKYQQQIINSTKSLIEQENIAHNERLNKAGIYNVKVENMTKKQLAALEAITVTHNDNLIAIETKSKEDKNKIAKKLRDDNIDDIKQAHDTELMQLQALQAKELTLFVGTEDQKQALIKSHNEEEINLKIKHLQALQNLLNNTLDFSINNAMLSDEERDALLFKIEQVKLSLAQLNLELKDNEEDEETGKGKFWQFMFGLDEESSLADKIQAIGNLALQTFSDINRIISNSENKQLQEFERSNNKKKQLLNKRLNEGIISQEQYNAQSNMLDEDLDKRKRALEHEQAKRAKALAIMGAIVNTAVAVTGALGTMPPPLGIALALLVGALGAVQIAAIATEPLPALASGNSADVLADNGKVYNANVTDNKHKSGLFNKPTVVPGFGIFGETAKPELVFNPVDTQRILDTPSLVDAINMTVKGSPVYAQGNKTEIIKENNTVTNTTLDNETKSLLVDIRNKLSEPTRAFLVADEDYLRTHNEKNDEYNEFQSRVN